MCDSTQGSLYSSPMKIHQSMWIQWLFFKISDQKVNAQMTPRWPLTPLLLRSHVQLYPRIIASNSHESTSKHVDTLTLFLKTLTKGQWPLDDLWSHFGWGHMCDSTQESLCPSPMGVHQCMWIQMINFAKYTTYYIQTYIHTTYVRSFWTKFRRDKKSLLVW